MNLSPILAYSLNDANLGADSSGSGLDATVTDVTLVTDSERGNVASFTNSTSKLVLSSASVPPSLIGRGTRTYAFWVNFSSTSTSMVLFNNGINSREKRFRLQLQANSTLSVDVKDWSGNGSIALSPGTWYHIACVFDLVYWRAYVNGTSDASMICSPNVSVAEGDFIIGEDDTSDEGFSGLMSDFRVYDTALSVEDIVSLSMITPDPPTSDGPLSFQLTPSVTTIKATVAEVDGAVSFRVTTSEDGSGVTRVTHTGISAGDVIIASLKPVTTYTVVLLADTGSGYEVVDTKTVTTLDNSPENYDISQFGSNGAYNLSQLSASDLATLGSVINDVFQTGDTLDIKVGNKASKVKFVKLGETVSTDDSIMVPFDSSGQQFTMQLSDASTLDVSYDDTTKSITLQGTSYSAGDSTIVDGKKMTVVEV